MKVKMSLEDVLQQKANPGVVTIHTGATMGEVVEVLSKNKIGGIVVCTDDLPVGIVTERDVLYQVAKHGPSFLTLPVSEVMTRDMVVGTFSDDVEAAKAIMTEKRFRHMPIMHEGKLVGIVSQGDLVRSQVTTAQAEARYMRDYIAGYYR